MATYSRSQTAAATQEVAPVQSMDLGSIIVNSFANVMDALDDNEQTEKIDYTKLKQTITKGIDESNFAKKNTDEKKETDEKKDKKDDPMAKLLKVNEESDKKLEGLLKSSKDKERKDDKAKKVEAKTKEVHNKTTNTTINKFQKFMGGTMGQVIAKVAIATAILSQLFVFLEGLIAKFLAQKDVKMLDFMAKVKAQIAVIPDRLRLMFEQILSKVRIMGQPIFGSLSKDEKEEYKALKKDEGLRAYGKAQSDYEKSKEKVNQAQQTIENYASSAGINTEGYNLNSSKGRELFQQDVLRGYKEKYGDQVNPETVKKWMNDAFRQKDINEGKLKSAENVMNNLYDKVDKDKLEKYLYYKDLDEKPRTAEYYENEQAKLDEKISGLESNYFTQSMVQRAEKGKLTQYELDFSNQLRGAGTSDKIKMAYSEAHSGEELRTAANTGAQRFLQNEYKQWTDSWEKLFKDFKQDIGIRITQKTEKTNALVSGPGR